jgi:membrane protease subunit (stomatin/prohibitin family)
MLPIRAFGQYGMRIEESKKFLIKLVGTLRGFDAETLSEYFRGVFITRIKTEIANAIVKSGISVLEIATQLEVLSDALKASLSADVEEYGVSLAQFNIHSISVPENDPAVLSLKKALAKKAEMGILGFNYQQERSFDVMQTAAGNEGTAGGVMGAGLGLGMGAAMGVPMGAVFGQMTPQLQPTTQPPSAAVAPVTSPLVGYGDRIHMLKELAELKATGVLSDEEFQTEKRRVLGN